MNEIILLKRFQDEAVTFSNRLVDLDKRVTLKVLRGLPHGFLSLNNISKMAQDGVVLISNMISKIVAWIKKDIIYSIYYRNRILNMTLFTLKCSKTIYLYLNLTIGIEITESKMCCITNWNSFLILSLRNSEKQNKHECMPLIKGCKMASILITLFLVINFWTSSIYGGK